MKFSFMTACGVAGGAITAVLGGWDAALSTLCIFMLADYITGVIVAGVFHKSGKTESGSLKSWEGFKGLCRKCVVILFVLIAHRLDIVIGVDYIRDGVIYGFMANEGLSLIENAGLMGVPLPDVVVKAVDILSKGSKNTDAK